MDLCCKFTKRVNTPNSHTCNPKSTSSSTPAGEDAGDEETDVGELVDIDGQNVETVGFEGEQPPTAAEYEGSRELQPATDDAFFESNGNQTFMEMNGAQTYEKDGNLRPESSGLKLGFGAGIGDAIDENSKFSAKERFNIDAIGDKTRLPATDISVDSNPLARDLKQTFRQRLRTKQQSMEIRSLKSAVDQFPRAVRCVRAVEKAPEFIGRPLYTISRRWTHLQTKNKLWERL
ncbi:UNVERIFIED_CONTAM: hypothetical protein Sindi_0097800 [Sesamum indicum]